MNTKTDWKAEALAAFAPALEERLLREMEYIDGQFLMLLERCESPIEAKFVLALFEHSEFDDMVVRAGDAVQYFGNMTDTLEVCAQYVVGPYRCDFAFSQYHPNGTWTRIIVECDGHDFHERTKEQAQRDRSRDRFLQAAGWRVFRFTGSELHRDAPKCVDEIAHIVMDDTFTDWRSK